MKGLSRFAVSLALLALTVVSVPGVGLAASPPPMETDGQLPVEQVRNGVSGPVLPPRDIQPLLPGEASLEELAIQADDIITGEVAEVTILEEGGGNIYTVVRLAVQDTIKGERQASTSFRVPGGELEGRGLWVSDTPEFSVGERVTVFLQKAGNVLEARHRSARFTIEGNRVVETGQALGEFMHSIREAVGVTDVPGSISPVPVEEISPAAVLPQITSVSPSWVSAGTGYQVVINGANFGVVQGNSRVDFWKGPGYTAYVSATVLSWSNTSIVCEVPSGASSARDNVGIKVVTAAGESNQYPVHVTFSYGGAKWVNKAPRFWINDNTPDCTDEWQAVIDGMQVWDRVKDADFYFEYAGRSTGTQFIQNGKSEIFWTEISDWQIAAQCYVWWQYIGGDPSNREVVECDIGFNEHHTWDTSGVASSATVDVLDVATHELGHCLYLKDLYGLDDNRKWMYGYVAQGAPPRRMLATEDIWAIQYIYPGASSRGQYRVSVSNYYDDDIIINFKSDIEAGYSRSFMVPAGQTGASWWEAVPAGTRQVSIRWVDPDYRTDIELSASLVVPVEGEAELSFDIPGSMPLSVITENAASVSTVSARLNGTLASLGGASTVSVSFQWGTSPGSYSNETPPSTMNSTGPFFFDLTGLSPQGTYYFRAKASGATVALGSEKSFTTNGTDIATIRREIGSGPDDGFSGAWAYANSVVWYEAGNPGQPYNAWFRFTDIVIPKGATIVEAYLEVMETRWDGGARLKIRAENNPNPTPPVSMADHNARTVTVAGVDWDTGFADSAWHSSPDFAPVIQELVNTYDYGKGAPVQILVDNDGGNGEVVGRTFEFDAPPRLTIKYRDGEVTPPVVTTSYASVVTDTLATLNGKLDSTGSYPAVSVSFVWGTTAGGPYSNSTPHQEMASPGMFSYPLTGLQKDTTYYFKAQATYANDTVYGKEFSFSTFSTPPTGKIAFENQGAIWTINADGTGLTQLTPTTTDYNIALSSPSWSKDGTKIVYVMGSKDIYIMNADGSNQRYVTDGTEPAFSPDGTRLVYRKHVFEESKFYICTINTDGSGQTRLAEGSAPAWSPDGTKIYYSVTLPSSYALQEIFVMNSDGSNQTRLTDTSACTGPACLPVCTEPDCSPDGSKLVYLRRDDSGMPARVYAIYTMDSDGSNQVKIGGGTRAGTPVWSPDGSQVAYSMSLAGVVGLGMYGVFIMNADGSSPNMLTEGYHPSWWAPAAPPPVNHPPTLDPIGNKTVNKGSLLQFTVTAYDPDSDPLAYSAFNLPAGATFDAATHKFSWTPTAAGIYSGIRFEVSDGRAADHEIISITVLDVTTGGEIHSEIKTGLDDGFGGVWGFYNDLVWYEAGNPSQPYSAWFRFNDIVIPKGANILEARLEVMETRWDSGVRLRLRAEDSPNPTAPASTADLDSRARTLLGTNWNTGFADSAWHESGNFALVIQELVDTYDYSQGAAMQILVDNDGGTGEVVGRTFEYGAPPRLYIKYHVRNVPVNQPPTLDPIGNKTATKGSLLQFTVTGSDPDNDPLTFSASNLPAGANFDPGTRTFSWTPTAAGTYPEVHFEVSDGQLTDYEDITIVVLATVPPVVEIRREIANGPDDGFSGAWGFYNGLGWYEFGASYNGWFRFTDITIPKGATILEAHLELVQASWLEGNRLKIRAEKAASPAAPVSTADHAAREHTEAGVDWESGFSDWALHNTPDFATVIQELVNIYSYSGGDMQVFIDNNSSTGWTECTGRSFESGAVPRLYIKYQPN